MTENIQRIEIESVSSSSNCLSVSPRMSRDERRVAKFFFLQILADPVLAALPGGLANTLLATRIRHLDRETGTDQPDSN